MALQVGMGLSRVLVLVGAGFTGSIVLRNGRLREILSELLDKSGEEPGAESENADTLASQVHRLAMEIRQLTSARPITFLNGNSGEEGMIASVLVPAATLGVLGYGYMWWKGLSFYDLMYVTKHNMANAVSNMTKYLDQVSEALSATKRHLTQRIENLDGKLDEHKEMSAEIRNEVTDVRGTLTNVNIELKSLQKLVGGLDGKISAIKDQQNFTCAGVLYLCKNVAENGGKRRDLLQSIAKRGYLGCAESINFKDMQQIADAIESRDFGKFKTEEILQDDTGSLKNLSVVSRTAILGKIQ